MKTELHLHTSEVSACGHVSARDGVNAYKSMGYDCIVVTDHFSPYFVDRCYNSGITDIKEEYLRGYREAKDEGDKIGLTVLLGTEVCLSESNNDYLVYGVCEDMFDNPDILKLPIAKFSEYCKQKGYLLYQAHPFRNHMKIVKPEFLFGIEVNNANPRHDSRNAVSQLWADINRLHAISGSDYHQTMDVGRGGIITNKPFTTTAELLEILKNDDYTLIK